MFFGVLRVVVFEVRMIAPDVVGKSLRDQGQVDGSTLACSAAEVSW
jgi:hypothetical protein